ncbi:DUF4412 domain-containing protein [Croceiramulus getboli]|nr:DUF4412 domain-containing protein [Flavobacteriaceae bacterium YJPT1-3]
MKNYRLFLMFLLLLGFANPVQAQFWKKLKKKVEDKVEETVVRKTSEKAEETTAESMDKIFNMEFPKNGEDVDFTPGNTKDLPEQYTFSWAYGLQMESKQFKGNALDLTYYLKPEATYWGAIYESGVQQGMTMIYDGPTEQMVMLMDQEGQKMLVATKMPKFEVGDNQEIEDYTMTKIAGKEILGYACDGYVLENDDYHFTMYVTFDTPISFSDIYGTSKQLPKGFDPAWLKQGDQEGLMMEMEMVDKNKKKNNVTMRCTQLEQLEYTIELSEYQRFGN